MSKIVWTEEQTAAIESRGHNLLVSAAAGSGKTALLTERLKQLVVKDGIDCSRLLVLTFTRAAAAEMRQRFKQKLYDSLNEEEVNLKEKEILEQINALTDAQISTIDAFAAAMTRRYFEAAEADPGFRVADNAELALLTEETIDEVFEALFLGAEDASDELSADFIKLADLYGGSRTNEGLKARVKELSYFLESIPYPEEWIKDTIEKLDHSDEDFIEDEAFRPLFLKLKETLDRAVNNYKKIQMDVADIPFSKTAKTKTALNNEIESVLNLENAATPKEVFEALENLYFCRLILPKKTDGILQDRIKELRGDSKSGIRKELGDLKKNYSGYDLELEVKRIKEMNEHFKALCRLVWRVNERLSEKKAAARIMSFNDLERALLKILEDPKARRDIQDEFDYIFLDEYQDTNDVQEAIIQKIENGYNRFMVGDIKQSIVRPYRAAEASA